MSRRQQKIGSVVFWEKSYNFHVLFKAFLNPRLNRCLLQSRLATSDCDSTNWMNTRKYLLARRWVIEWNILYISAMVKHQLLHCFDLKQSLFSRKLQLLGDWAIDIELAWWWILRLGYCSQFLMIIGADWRHRCTFTNDTLRIRGNIKCKTIVAEQRQLLPEYWENVCSKSAIQFIYVFEYAQRASHKK